MTAIGFEAHLYPNGEHPASFRMNSLRRVKVGPSQCLSACALLICAGPTNALHGSMSCRSVLCQAKLSSSSSVVLLSELVTVDSYLRSQGGYSHQMFLFTITTCHLSYRALPYCQDSL